MIKSDCSERSPIIHIGMPKTATKTLQWRVFAEHSDIYYLGRFDGPSYREKYRQFEACRDAQVLEIMDQIAYRGIRNPDTAACHTLLKQYLQHCNPQHRLPVWSWESYCTDSHKNRELRAGHLKKVFGNARILVTIRHPVKLLESAYLQQLKRDNIGARYHRGKKVFYRPIDRWLQRDKANDITNHLDYPETIRMYTQQFGVENVCVLTFEQLQQDRAVFFEKLCEFMGIDLQETLTLVDTSIDNSRWTDTQLGRLQTIDNSLFQSLKFRYAKRPMRRKMLNLDKMSVPLTPGSKASAIISPEWQSQILKRTLSGNQWLEETFNLGLDELGYMDHG